MLVTLLATIVLDVAAGQPRMQAVALATLAVVLGAFRLGFACRSRWLFAALSGALVLQPAVHIARTAAPRLGGGHVDIELLGTDIPDALTQLLLTVLIVGSVICAESVPRLVAGVVRRRIRRRPPFSPPCICRAAIPLRSQPLPPARHWAGRPVRRGPPALLRVVP